MNLHDSLKVGSRIKLPTVTLISNVNHWVHQLFNTSNGCNLEIENSNTIQEPLNSEVLELIQAKQRLELELQDRERVETELKQLNKEMRLALEKEKKLNEHKSKLLSMASHELRTPLTTIMVSVDMIETYSQSLNQKQKEKFLSQIKMSSEVMTELMNEILQYNHLDAGCQKLNVEPLDLIAFCAKMLDEMRLIAGDTHQIGYTIHHDNGSPVYEVDCKVLRQILTNLLSNAIKYSGDSGEIKLHLKLTNHAVIFQVEDQGVGIPRDDLDALFEVFQRGSNVGNIQGTGLGLAIVKKNIDLHQGTIQVESEVNRGSTFTVTLPLHRCSI